MVRAYKTFTIDTKRMMLRIKAIYRSRGIPTGGSGVYQAAQREQGPGRIPAAGMRQRAVWLYEQLDPARKLRKQTKLASAPTRQAHEVDQHAGEDSTRSLNAGPAPCRSSRIRRIRWRAPPQGDLASVAPRGKPPSQIRRGRKTLGSETGIVLSGTNAHYYRHPAMIFPSGLSFYYLWPAERV